VNSNWLIKKLTNQLPKSLSNQFSNSDSLIKSGIILTLLCYRLFPFIAKRLPFLPTTMKMINALAALHKDEKIGALKLNSSDRQCIFYTSRDYVFDEVVIGSGPGGAIAANLSAKKNQKVLLVEEGVLKSKNDHHSLAQLMFDFRNSGQEVILGLPIIPFAQGKVIGGSSEINSGLYHRLPNHVKSEWLSTLDISEKSWHDAEIAIESSLSINKQDDRSLGVYSKSPLKDASERMNWDCQLIPRWRTYSGEAFIHFGMADTFLRNENRNLQVLPNHKVFKIFPGEMNHEIELIGSSCTHKIKSKKITISCGAVETPRLLARSKLLRRRDFHFGFHAMSRVLAIFGHNVNDLKDIDPHQAWTKKFETKFGVSVSTKGFLEATIKSLDYNIEIDHKKALVFYASTAMHKRGKFLRLGKEIYPAYFLSKDEMKTILNSTIMLTNGLKKAGALSVLSNIYKPSLSTVHIFGSLPIGRSPVDSQGTLKNIGYPSIRVCDTSIFPSPPLVNPQGPLMHLAFVLTEKWLSND
jgi:hypothetical protein